MSPRRNRPRRRAKPVRPDEPEPRAGGESTEEWRGEEWVVRRISAQAAAKYYRCPGCDQEIPPGVAHVVAWALLGAVEDRRHWHQACWNARDRRSPRLRRFRQAPWY
mgnify:CR=1 FL=1